MRFDPILNIQVPETEEERFQLEAGQPIVEPITVPRAKELLSKRTIASQPAVSPIVDTPVAPPIVSDELVLPDMNRQSVDEMNTLIDAEQRKRMDPLDLAMAGPSLADQQAAEEKQNRLLEIKSKLNMANALSKAFGGITSGALGLAGGSVVKPTEIDMQSPMTDALIAKGIQGPQQISALDRAKLILQKKQLQDDATRRGQDVEFRNKQLNLEKQKLDAMKSKSPISLSEGEKQADRVFGKEYANFEALGGKASLDGKLRKIDDVISRMEKSKNFSGPITGLSVKTGVANITNPKAVAIKQDMENLVTETLRQILGAQFTQKEGENLLARTFNPDLPEEVNINRAKELARQLKDQAKTKGESVDYYRKNKTLSGWEGATPSMQTLNPEVEQQVSSFVPTVTFQGIPLQQISEDVYSDSNGKKYSLKPKVK